MLLRARAVGAGLHDRHRSAVPGDLRGLARAREPLRRPRRGLRRRGRERPRGAPAAAARSARSPRSTARSRPRRLDHRAAPRAGADPRRGAEAVVRRAPQRLEGQPDRRLGRQARCGTTSPATTCPTTSCTTAATNRSAASPAPFPGRARRALGRQRQDRVRHPRLRRAGELRPADGARPPASTHLRALESEAVHVMREVVAAFERPVLLFSGGKDSIVLLRLAEKAFRPAAFPFPLMHIDTGENFPRRSSFVIVARSSLVSG